MYSLIIVIGLIGDFLGIPHVHGYTARIYSDFACLLVDIYVYVLSWLTTQVWGSFGVADRDPHSLSLWLMLVLCLLEHVIS